MAWLVRAILKTYRSKFGRPPLVQRRARFQAPVIRFNAVFYGDKQVWQAWARSENGELGAVIRAILAAYFAGEFVVDFGDVFLIKEEKKPRKSRFFKKKNGRRYACAELLVAKTFQPEEYRPVNRAINLWLMNRGLKNKKFSHVDRIDKWIRTKMGDSTTWPPVIIP